MRKSRRDLPDLSAMPQGIVRTRDLAAIGMTRTRIRRFASRGQLVSLGRGLYCAPELDLTPRDRLVGIIVRVPKATLCLSSALEFHGMRTKGPDCVTLMLPRGCHPPRVDDYNIRTYHTTGDRLGCGIEEHEIHGVKVRVTSVARTVVDCFRYRHRTGMDLALSALAEAMRGRLTTVDELIECSRVCRVERFMRPYIEGMAEAMCA